MIEKSLFTLEKLKEEKYIETKLKKLGNVSNAFENKNFIAFNNDKQKATDYKFPQIKSLSSINNPKTSTIELKSEEKNRQVRFFNILFLYLFYYLISLLYIKWII